MNTTNSEEENIQNCIEHYLRGQKLCKCKYEISQICNTYISKILDVVVNCENEISEKKKLSFFVKMAKDYKGFRIIFGIREKYNREIYFYKYIIPQFAALQEEKKVLKKFKSYPKVYTSSDECLKEMVILENLLESGFKVADQYNTLDYNHALLVMKELGRFHALSFAVKDQQPQIFQKLFTDLDDLEFHGNFGITTKTYFQHIFPLCINAMQSLNSVEGFKKLSEIQDKFCNILEKAVECETTEPYNVINHGDAWITNMLFKYDEFCNPTETCLVDFQASKLCTPVSDLSQFLFSCTSHETRKKYHHQLILEYYSSLSSFLRELGSDPEQLFPFNVLQDHLKRFSIVGFALAIKLNYAKSIATQDFPKLDVIDDGVTFAQMIYNAKKDLTYFNGTIGNIVLDFIEFGYDL